MKRVARLQTVQGHKAHFLLKVIVHLRREVLQLESGAATRAAQAHLASGPVQEETAAASRAMDARKRLGLGPFAV